MRGAEGLVASLGGVVCAGTHPGDAGQLPLEALAPLESPEFFGSLLFP